MDSLEVQQGALALGGQEEAGVRATSGSRLLSLPLVSVVHGLVTPIKAAGGAFSTLRPHALLPKSMYLVGFGAQEYRFM